MPAYGAAISDGADPGFIRCYMDANPKMAVMDSLRRGGDESIVELF